MTTDEAGTSAGAAVEERRLGRRKPQLSRRAAAVAGTSKRGDGTGERLSESDRRVKRPTRAVRCRGNDGASLAGDVGAGVKIKKSKAQATPGHQQRWRLDDRDKSKIMITESMTDFLA